MRPLHLQSSQVYSSVMKSLLSPQTSRAALYTDIALFLHECRRHQQPHCVCVCVRCYKWVISLCSLLLLFWLFPHFVSVLVKCASTNSSSISACVSIKWIQITRWFLLKVPYYAEYTLSMFCVVTPLKKHV